LQITRKVGVYVITNREHPKFSDCINAIKREMKDFPFFIIRDGKTRAEGRQICIGDARKRGFDWICFVDDDFVRKYYNNLIIFAKTTQHERN